MKPDPADPYYTLKEDFKNSINLRPPQEVHVGKGDISVPAHPPEDGRWEQFIENATRGFVRMMEQSFDGHSLPWSTIERELRLACEAGWTARVKRERELREAGQDAVAVFAALLIGTKWELSFNILSALRNAHDKLLATLSESEPEKPRS